MTQTEIDELVERLVGHGCVTGAEATQLEDMIATLAASQERVQVLRDALDFAVDNNDLSPETHNYIRQALAEPADYCGIAVMGDETEGEVK